nr:KTSC domain-containing protein [Parvularcula dongshanensis]
MVYWSSSLFDRAEYDAFSRRLFLWFAGDADPYAYEGVPLAVWHGLQRAPSKGAYFARAIRNRYEGVKSAA